MIGIIDYGAGNLRSVKKALDYLGAESEVISDPAALDSMDKALLPGVGAFGAAMQRLAEQRFITPLQRWMAADRPFLGICLGMQLLFERSEESTGVAGLGHFGGTVRAFTQHKVPQIGWNQLHQVGDSPLLAAIEDGSYFYFLHGYYVAPDDPSVVIGTTDYGLRYASVVQRGRVMGAQFHPEKSADVGLALLQNWIDRC
ncbi:MAG: imidazole glycerol phosphate synthase subunit HisH [Anaerolineales bacterium]|nr:imidazole glycerol phosphate synthase subunit HisH [Anaerolineales bacterium]MCB9126488.1 imidazole glycerol phosphate synthase subunit HisH [Ardenticatenales bacterium]